MPHPRTHAPLLGWLALVSALGCAIPTFQPVARPLDYAVEGPCTPAGGPPGDAALRESAGLAEGVVGDVLAALGNEFPEERRQFIPRAREPLQRFPRLTFPALIDPTPAPRGSARRTPAWMFPLVIDKKQLGDIPVEAMTGELRFWLVPHGADGAVGVDVTECLVRNGARDALFASDDERRPEILRPGRLIPTIARRDRLRALVFEIPTRAAGSAAPIAPGFYDLRVRPRLNALREVTVRTPALESIRRALVEGDWSRALELARNLRAGSLPAAEAPADLRALAGRVAPRSNRSVTFHPSPHFDLDLQRLRDVLLRLAKQIERSPRGDGATTLALSRLEQPMRSVLVGRQSAAPVALKDPERERGRCGGRDCVRIAVAGDFQYHANLATIRRFLGMLDPAFVQAAAGAEGPEAGSAVPDVDFVLFAGDLADAAAGSAKEQLLLNVLGLLPPTSPYGEDGGREMTDIRDQLARFQKPFFAVPGNHDGYAGYGGLLNVLVDELGFATEESIRLLFRAPRLGRAIGSGIKSANSFIPTLVGWRLLNRHPRYDGLGEFQSYLGPLNLAFAFRGHSFVGVNSYDLDPKQRASVGGVVLHWGGGLQDHSIDWVDEMLNRFPPEPDREQFVFMHHDPRGAVPTKSGYTEQQFGLYDAIDTPVSQLTMGHAGLGNSPKTGLYLPVVSFVGTFLWRGMEIGWGDDAGSFQQEWMRQPDWGWSGFPNVAWPRFFDHEAYNAQGLIEVVNCNLAGRTGPPPEPTSRRGVPGCNDAKGRVSQILFAHDNVPADTMWAETAERGAVFREPTNGQLWRSPRQANSIPSQFGGLFGLKARNGSPPAWAQYMRLDDTQGNARVLRLDDVGDAGNYHGFHVITLYDDGKRETQWFALPR